ncbi:hypothetical protein OTB20_28940 [Streptomyces sp. H27-H1]|uniref:hypothetical protein n=1 Tax=Streptomyces sp. H27-H1 TaxID=2996461 RepID=UPI00226F3B27|nr:hypothetical protein [Streptomyces sp. H27-H1]MCY0930147.1 hypothetical protein [Streptomyces sp. H27-H1]
MAVVVLHPHTVLAGDHQGRVRGPLADAVLDDDPGLRPRHQARDDLVVMGRRIGDGARHGRHPDRDAALARQIPVHEGELVADRGAVRPDRIGRADTGAGRVVAEGVEQTEGEDDQGRQGHGDEPARAPEAGPLLPEDFVVCEHAPVLRKRR